MLQMDVVVFDVGLGQSILFSPKGNPDCLMLVDCGNTESFEPVDQIISWNLLKLSNKPNGKYILPNLTLTNYDEDHFSGLPYLVSKTEINSIIFPKNLTSIEIIDSKEEKTPSLEALLYLKDTYIYEKTLPETFPYNRQCFYLDKSDFQDIDATTNNLSQVVFVAYNGITICIPGDLTSIAWEKLLRKDEIKDFLKRTTIFVASHHGREDGYCAEVFFYCKPECVIISDKMKLHSTQENMTSLYASKVFGKGIQLDGDSSNSRKVLTTRNDGTIYIRILDNGSCVYSTFK